MFAGAAFTDSADIKVDTEVVDTLVSLGVVNGYTDGSFKPNDTVTRAEMAKMIYVLRTGNSDASAYNDDKTTFTDIKGHWARGYVKYCQALGIIAGQSATKFAPDANVTAQEAAKMLLVTLGYNADKAGLVGATWATKTNALADENGLLEDVNTSFTAACPRQYAAQLIYNTIFAHTVALRDGEYTNMNLLGTDKLETVGEKYMGLKTTVSILTGVTKESNKDTYKVVLSASDVKKTDSDKVNDKYVTTFTKVSKDYSALSNRMVKVLFKNSDEVYGVFATDDSSVLNGVVGDYEQSGNKVKYDGTKYTVSAEYVTEDDTEVKDKSVVQYVNTASSFVKAADVKTVLDDNDKIISMDVTKYMIGKVSYVGKDYVNVVHKAGYAATNFSGYAKLDKDSCNSNISDLKKNDYVIITKSKVNSKLDAVKTETVEGKITSTRDSGNEVRIDDNWYKSALKDNNDIKLSNTVTVVLKGSYIAYVDDVKTGSNDVALLIEAGTTTGVGAKLQADLLFPDGSRKVVDVKDKSTGINNNSKNVLVTYEQSGSKYELHTIEADSKSKYAGYDHYTDIDPKSYVDDEKVKKADKSVDSYINDSATIFLKYGSDTDTDDYKVVTGADMKKWSDTNEFSGKVLTDDSKGYPYIKVGFIKTTKNPSSGDKTYAYIFDVANTAKDANNNEYVEYNVWNGTEATTLKVKQSAGSAYAEGTVVEYTLDSDGYADCAPIYNKDHKKLTAGALTGFAWAGKGKDGDVMFNGNTANTYKIDKDDTIVLFVDTDGKTGVADGSLQEAIKDAAGANTGYTKNVAYYINDATKTLNVLVVDVTNEIKTELF
nr:S-layer homology domain-containing protein [uncultured Agathobaculum sp.]